MREFTQEEFDRYTAERAAANREQEYRRGRAKLIAQRREQANRALESAAKYDHAARNGKDPIALLEYMDTYAAIGSVRFNAALDMWNVY